MLIDGRPVDQQRISTVGTDFQTIRLNLPAGGRTITLSHDPSYAGLIQPRFEPNGVPKDLLTEIKKDRIAEIEVPGLPDNKVGRESLRNLQSVVQSFWWTRRLAERLVQTDQVVYDRHTLHPKLANFKPAKVALNIAAGKVAQLSGIPQKRLEATILEQTGFEYDQLVDALGQYRRVYEKKFPERLKRVAGSLRASRAVLTSATDGPGWIFEADETPAGAKRVLCRLATRAYGRPVGSSELATLMTVYETSAGSGDVQSHRRGLRDAMVALLISPKFLLRFTEEGGGPDGKVDDDEYASRLSHFFWLSLPDDALLRAAKQGKLHPRDASDEALQPVLEHLIDDPRFEEVCQIFASQWLDIDEVQPSRELGAELVDVMLREPGYLIRDIFRENRSVLELISSRDSYVDELLAGHYDMPGVVGSQVRKLSAGDFHRGGLLGMGAVLVATSTPQRTSPVNRGAWVAEILLGEELPLPPPTVPELKVAKQTTSVREALELHRQSKACAGCHDRIDPYGFVLENFDLHGRWRDREAGKPVDSSTTLVDGSRLNGLDDLKGHLLGARRDDFVRNLVTRLYEFALGREMQYSDEAMIQQTTQSLAQNDFRSHVLLREIVRSDAFIKQSRR